MPRRRRGKSKTDPYKRDECRKCGEKAIPPTAARYCREHMPTTRICLNCGDEFKWSIGGPGLCPTCHPVLIDILVHEHPRWEVGALKELRRRTGVKVSWLDQPEAVTA